MKLVSFLLDVIKNKEMYRFATVGAGSAGSVLLLTFILTYAGRIFYMYSVALAFELSVIWAFFCLDRWTFKDVMKKNSAKQRFLRYNMIAILGLGVNEVILLLLAKIVGLHYLIAEFFAIVFTFGFNYIVNKKFAWNSKHIT